MYERGGWSRDYHLTFKELLNYVKDWDVKVDLNDSDYIIAEIATNIILANNASLHGLDPFRYLPKTNKITDPKDKAILKQFEMLFKKYNHQQIIVELSEEIKNSLRKFNK